MLKRNSQTFWNEWKKNFGVYASATVISDYTSSSDICDGFVVSFKNNFEISDD